MKRFAFVLSLVLAFAGVAHAADTYPDYPIKYPADAIRVSSGGDVEKALANGRTVLVEFGGKYKIPKPLMLRDNQTLGVYGDGRKGWATFDCPAGGLSISERHHVTIQGIQFRGNGKKAVGVRLLNVNNVRLLNSAVTGFGSFGILCEGYNAYNRDVMFNGVLVADNKPSGSSLCSGIFASYTNGLVISNSVFDANGKTNDDDAAKRNHNAYISASCGPIVAFGNVFSNASSHGLQARSGGDISYNVFFCNPLGLSYGMVNGDKCYVGGISGEVHHNVFWGGGTINGDPRGWPVEISNVKNASVHDNLIGGDMKATGEAVKVSACNALSNPKNYVGIQTLRVERIMVWNFKKDAMTSREKILKLGRPLLTLSNIGIKPPKSADLGDTLGKDFINVIRQGPTGKGKVYADKCFDAVGL